MALKKMNVADGAGNVAEYAQTIMHKKNGRRHGRVIIK